MAAVDAINIISSVSFAVVGLAWLAAVGSLDGELATAAAVVAGWSSLAAAGRSGSGGDGDA